MWGHKTYLFIIAIMTMVACSVPLSENETGDGDGSTDQNTGGGANADSGTAGSDTGDSGAAGSGIGEGGADNVPSCSPEDNCVGCETCFDICRCINPQNTVADCNQLCGIDGTGGAGSVDCQCSPGEQIPCGCSGDSPDAFSGVQVCESDCMRYGPCDCSGNTGGATGTGGASSGGETGTGGSGTGGSGIGGASSGGTSGTGGSSSCDWICEPGFQMGCACPGDLLGEMSGVQTCAPDGCSFGPCELCPSGTGGSGTGGSSSGGTGGASGIGGATGTGGSSSGGTGGTVVLIDNDGDRYFANPPAGVPWDCNDADASIHPFADEVCNGVDDDCDGDVDEGLVCGDGYVAVTYTCVSPDGVHDAMEVQHEAKNYGDAWGNDLPRTYPYGPFRNGATTPYALSFAYGVATDGPDNDPVCLSYGLHHVECTVHVPAGSHVAYDGHYGDQGDVQSWMCTGPNGETSGYCIVRNAATGEIIPQGWHYWPTTDGCRFEYTAPTL